MHEVLGLIYLGTANVKRYALSLGRSPLATLPVGASSPYSEVDTCLVLMFWYCVCGYGILVGESLGFWVIDRFRVELGGRDLVSVGLGFADEDFMLII